VEEKQIPVLIEKSNSSSFDAQFVMSATSPDRVKDTIDESAYKPNLGKKLIALWQHNSSQPIGYWENIRVEAGKLIGDLKVSSINLGQMVKQLIADGVPLGASIGFQGKGKQNKQGGVHFTEIELLECSVVSIPAHPKAMQIAKSFGFDLYDANKFGFDKGAAASIVGSEKRRKAVAVLTIANATISIKGKK
jgi:HK97 family phage prohead protease